MKLKAKQQSDFSREAGATANPPEFASEQIMRERNARRVKRFVRIQKRMRFHMQRQPRPTPTLLERVRAWFRLWFTRQNL